MQTPAVASALLSGLNAQQREAVLAADGPVLILAGAGSGKTRVITRRIAHLVLERGVPSEAILAVTFTNKAAAEMKARTEALLDGQALYAWISTFHSLCVRLLRREHAAAGLPRDFVIYDQADQLSVVRAALRALDLSEKLHPPQRVLSRISAAKNARGRRSPAPDAGDESLADALHGRLAARYQEFLTAAQALDFDDLLLHTVALLSSQATVRESYQRRFQYLLVDEYQDTNRTQYELVRLLSGARANITVVGDEDQSIYSWRGADIQNILDFEADYPGARVLRLEENYRSTQPILDAASGVVAHNTRRKGKTLVAVQQSGDRVLLHEAADEFHEAAFVVAEIRARRGQGRAAILYRMNSQSRVFEEELLRAGIAYLVVGGVGFYERKEVKDVLAYLRVVQNPEDPVAVRRVLNVPARGIGARTEEELERLAAQRGASFWEAMNAAVDEALLPARAALPLQRFRDLVRGLQEDAARLGLRDLLSRVMERSGYSAALAQDDGHEAQDRLANLAELLSAAADYELREPEPSVAGFLDRVALLSDADQVRDDARVVLMTLHSAKGLEFDSVHLVGVEEGLLPHARSLLSEQGLEEERRLCYVGMTRAMRKLTLTWVRTRQVFGQRRLAEPSRFLTEVPERCAQRTSSERRGAALAGQARSGWGGREMFQDRGTGRTSPTAATPRMSQSTLPAPLRPSWAPPTPAAASTDGTLDLRPGVRVRHALFGVGTVVRREGAGDETKVTVSFPGVGMKRLVARFAGLEPA